MNTMKSKMHAVFVLSLVFVAFSANGYATDFRGLTWYSTIDEVKRKETAQLSKEYASDDALFLAYKTIIFDEPASLKYTFDPICRQLVFAHYYFPKELSTAKYYFIIDTLKQKYGEWASNNYEIYVWNIDTTHIEAIQKDNIRSNEGNTTIKYHTTKFNWLIGFIDGAEPTCPEKEDLREKLKKKL